MLERHRDIDLVVIDIHMSRMDGITFLERLQSVELPVKPLVVVLSAYPDYDYVRQAFLLGAVDYIVKAELDPEPMNAVIRKMSVQLEEKRERHELKLRQQSSELQRRKEEAIVAVLRDKELEHSQVQSLKSFQAPASPVQIVVCMMVDLPGDPEKRAAYDAQTARYLIHTARQALDQQDVTADIIAMDVYEYALLIGLRRSGGQKALREQKSRLLNQVISHMKQYLNISVTIGASSPCSEWTEWRGRYEQAQSLANLRFFNGGGRIYYSEHLPGTDKGEQTGQEWHIQFHFLNLSYEM